MVFCESKEDAEKSVSILTEWLKVRGLTLSPEKTRIVHLSEGFDFLGFNIRHYKAEQTSKSGWKLLIKPSKESVRKIREKLRDKWLLLRSQNVKTVISHLNPIIRGWANYFRIGVASEAFRSLDNWMIQREFRYINRMHPKKPRYWTNARYFGKLNPDSESNWVFGDKRSRMFLQRFIWFPIERHALVQGNASPDNSCLRDYWEKRRAAKAKDLVPSRAKIAGRQKGLCLRCGESLFNGEEIHLHHKVWKSKGGEDKYSNFELAHLFCHQQIHAVTA